MLASEYEDSYIVRALEFAEKRYTPKGLAPNEGYQIILREAYRRGIRKRILTEQEILDQLLMDGPGFDVRG